jgi:DNA-binding transcriptional MocR family regulator
VTASAPTVSATRTARLVGDVAATRPAYRALADSLRVAVADGRIPLGSRLPSERELTTALGVSRTTVSRAYDVLRASGYLVSRRGSGSVVTLPEGSRHRGTSSLFGAEPLEDVIDLTCAATRAPVGVVEAYERAVASLPRYLTGAGYLALGVPELREAIADRYTARGLPTGPEDVVVTSGALAGIGVVTSALVGHGDRVVVENPGYPNTLDVLRRAGARLAALPVDPEGWDVAESVATVRSAAAGAAVLVPDFQNPTAALLSDEGRERLASALRRAGTTPVIDETIVEIDLEGGSMPLPFAAHSPGAITVGSASKSHWGGLRAGWLRAPRGRIAHLIESRASSNLGPPVLEQLVLLELMRAAPGITEGRRADVRHARASLVAALAEHLPDVSFTLGRGGLSLWCRLPADLPSTRLAVAAEDHGLLLAAGPRFAVDGGLDGWLRLPHVLPGEAMSDAVVRLGRAAEQVRSERGRVTRARHSPPGGTLIA